MTSPDVTPYVDLTLSDQSSQELLNTALERLAMRAPEYAPRETGLEMILLEGMAEMVEQSIFAINRLPGTIFEVVMKAFGIERYLGAQPRADLTFIVANSNGYVIPGGTRSVLTTDVGSTVFTLNSEVVIPAGSNTGSGTATGGDYTSNFNGIPANTDLALLDAVPYVDYVRTATLVTDGADAETDDEYLARGASRFSRLSETLVLPDHFVQAALESPLVERAYALDNYNPAAGEPGTAAGHIALAVYGKGAPLSAAERENLRTSLAAATAANLAVHVVDPTITTVAISATVISDGTRSLIDVQAECEAVLREYISVDSWPWSGTVWRNEIIALLSNALGVERVALLTVPNTDLTLAGYAPLAQAGTITITAVDA